MERTWTHLSLELKALSFQYFSVSPRWLAQWMNSEPKSSVLAVDEGAILDAVFENFNHPTPSGFERIMIEKALLWWMSLYVPKLRKLLSLWCIAYFLQWPSTQKGPCCDHILPVKMSLVRKKLHFLLLPPCLKLPRNELPDYEIKLSGLSVGVYIKMI